MRILVTGAAGFIGSSLVDRLLRRGDQVIGLDNFDPFYAAAEKRANLGGALQNSAFRLVEGDVTDQRALDSALSGPATDIVVHLAAKAGVRPSIEDPEAYVRTNRLGTQSVLHAAAKREIRGFVFGSSSSVYGNAPEVPFAEDSAATDPISPYAASKRAAELLCREHQSTNGGGMLCLRFFTVYGPRQRPDLAIRKFCTLIERGRPIPFFGDGTTERDYTWIDDILDGLVAAIDRSATGNEEFEIINLGHGRPVSLSYLVELLGRSLGTRPLVDRLPAQTGDVIRTWADISKARRLLGYAPRTRFEDGITSFVRWFAGTLSTKPPPVTLYS